MNWMYILKRKKNFQKSCSIWKLSIGIARPVKTDYLKKEIWYSIDNNVPTPAFSLGLKEVKDIIQKNKRGIKPDIQIAAPQNPDESRLEVHLDERIDRFDKNKSKKQKPYRKKKRLKKLHKSNN